MFQKAKQNRIFQDVVDQIQEAILDGRIRVGESLPAERELRELFGVSRGTLREALRILEQKGLIEIRLGANGGAVVLEASTGPVSESLALLIRHQKVSLAHLAEFREEVEGFVTGLAARRARPEDIERLQRLLAQAETHHAAGLSGWEAFVRIDRRIHMALADAAGNPIYTVILQTLHDNIYRYYERFLAGTTAAMADNYRDLTAIVAAVSRADAEQARHLARRHVQRFTRRMQEQKTVDSATPASKQANREFRSSQKFCNGAADGRPYME